HAQQLSRARNGAPTVPRDRSIRVAQSIAVNASPEACYRFWRDFQNLPRFMRHLESVRLTGDKRSRWTLRMPPGNAVEWEAEVINEIPGDVIAWRSLEGSDVDSAGAVRFEAMPSGRGTVIRVKMNYRPPAGQLGSAV